MPDTLKGAAVALLIFLYFGLMSRIDFIVNSTLYEHGLQFSYAWALDYWTVYTAVFVLFSATISMMYWLGSSKTARDLKLALGILVTVVVLMLSGLQDVMFFVLWKGGLPPNNVVWWWVPWVHIFGTWTSLTQIVATTTTLVALAAVWVTVYTKQAPRPPARPTLQREASRSLRLTPQQKRR
jgi:hypothetical protein